MTPYVASFALTAHLPLGTALALIAAPSLLIAVIMQFLARVRRKLGVETMARPAAQTAPEAITAAHPPLILYD